MKQNNAAGWNIAMLFGGLAAGILGGRLIPPLLAALGGSGRVRAGGDPFALLIADHRQILSLLERMRASSPGSNVQRSRLFLMLKRKLAKHALAEEDVVYPVVHGRSVEVDESRHLYDAHADMKIRLYELEDKLRSGEDWSAEVDYLADLIRRHVDEEETRIFPRLREQLTEAGSPKISGQISREEALIV